MKAVFFRKHGGNEVLEYGDWPTPEAGPGEVRVGIRAAIGDDDFRHLASSTREKQAP